MRTYEEADKVANGGNSSLLLESIGNVIGEIVAGFRIGGKVGLHRNARGTA